MLSPNKIEEEVDFERLKKCNEICMKWSRQFNVVRNDHVVFCTEMMKDLSSYRDKLPEEYRSEFSKDCQIMFYAAKVENILISQYHAMVHNILRRLVIAIDERDHYETDGLLAIRNAIWGFIEHETKATFSTYVYNSIFNRIRGIRFKEYEKRMRRGNKFNLIRQSDFDEKFHLDMHAITKDKDNDNFINLENELDELAKKCSLSEEESYMLQCFANRINGQSAWYQTFNEKYQNVCKKTIRNQLRKLQRKIFIHMKKNNLIPNSFKIKRN
jgi:hypothetical protein